MSLIFTRCLGESFYIGDDIIVTVTNIAGGQVKMAIDAPKDVKVHRKEIYLKIAAENESKGENK